MFLKKRIADVQALGREGVILKEQKESLCGYNIVNEEGDNYEKK